VIRAIEPLETVNWLTNLTVSQASAMFITVWQWKPVFSLCFGNHKRYFKTKNENYVRI